MLLALLVSESALAGTDDHPAESPAPVATPAEPAPPADAAPPEPAPPADPPPPEPTPSADPPPPEPAPSADPPPPEPAPEPDATAPGGLPAAGIEGAETAEEISRKELRALRPSPFHLPQNPRGQVDFTAYTLEFGEVKLGLANMTVGILPHVQAGTSVPLDILGIPNVTAKAHVAEGGPYDFAGYVNYYILPREALTASYLSVGAIHSLRILEPWSIHVGGGYVRVHAEGTADISTVTDLWGVEEASTVSASVTGHGANLTIATDVRLNRRDSVIVRAESLIWAKTDTSLSDGAIGFLGLDEVFDTDGFLPVDTSTTASISWQLAWEHIELRLGIGVPLSPPAWILQSTELCYRFGGKSRAREREQRKTWQKNRKDVLEKE